MALQKVDKVLSNISEGEVQKHQTHHTSPNAMEIIEAGGEVCGPHRVIPGRLSVSRAIGDAHAKVPKVGGNPNVITSEPEIKYFKITPAHDFIVMGSDGLYDKLSNSDLISEIWQNAIKETNSSNFNEHRIALSCAQRICKHSMNLKNMDNVTGIVICF
jgi:protein phosphatase 2C family protein 2/3